jgi:multidrug efflux pump
MNVTDIFIKRPVLATVLSLLIFVLGLRAMGLLSVREYPATQNAVVTVTTVYTGADPALVSGFITTPLENSIAQANGIDYLSSSSSQSVSVIKANLRLNYDSNKALTEINTRVNAVINQLPREAQQPSIVIAVGESIASMYIGFYSKTLPANKLSDYIIRVVQPKIQTVEGVQTAEILGSRQFALRAWLDPQKMGARGVTAADVNRALVANNVTSAIGRTQGQMVVADLTASTGIHTLDEFRDLVIKTANGVIVRLGDVAKVTLGSENYDTTVAFDG